MITSTIETNRISGITDLVIKFHSESFCNIKETDKQSFLSKQDAVFYLQRTKKDLLIKSLAKYLASIKELTDDNHSGYYKTPIKRAQYTYCFEQYSFLLNYELNVISRYIYDMREKLLNLLPQPTSKHYSRLAEPLTSLIAFAKNEIAQ